MSCFCLMKPFLFTEYQKQISQRLLNHPVGTHVQEFYLYDDFHLIQFNLQKNQIIIISLYKDGADSRPPALFHFDSLWSSVVIQLQPSGQSKYFHNFYFRFVPGSVGSDCPEPFSAMTDQIQINKPCFLVLGAPKKSNRRIIHVSVTHLDPNKNQQDLSFRPAALWDFRQSFEVSSKNVECIIVVRMTKFQIYVLRILPYNVNANKVFEFEKLVLVNQDTVNLGEPEEWHPCRQRLGVL